MPDDNEVTMLTTADADVHVVEGEIDLVRMKVERNKWLLTVDGRLVRTDKVVSVWVPTQEELRSYMEGIESD